MADIKELAKELTSGDQVRIYKAERKLVELTAAAGAAEKEAKRKQLAADIAQAIAELQPKYDNRGNPTVESQKTVDGRNKLIRYLALVAGDEQVEVLVEALKNQDSQEMARWALERITSPAATKALVKAAQDSVEDRFRIGAINALAGRDGAEVLHALKKCVTDLSAPVRLAAAEALGAHADPEADAAIVRAGKGTGRRGQLRVAKARLRLAENLLRAGHPAPARKICEEVIAAKNMPAQKKSAQILLQRFA